MMRSLVAIGLAGALCVQSAPHQTSKWTWIFDVRGRCYFAVPPDWNTDNASGSIDGFVWSPDGRATAVLQWVQRSITSILSDLRRPERHAVVHELTVTRLYAEYASGSEGRHLLTATAATDGVCLLDLDLVDGAGRPLEQTVQDVIATVEAVGR